MPEKVAAAVVEFMLGDLIRVPRVCGGRLNRELDGLLSARRGPYRLIYQVDDEAGVVDVLRIEHRSVVYRT
jgi:mRNA interferase RelE/StbE